MHEEKADSKSASRKTSESRYFQDSQQKTRGIIGKNEAKIKRKRKKVL